MSLLDICNVTMQTEMCSSRQQTCAKSLSPVWFFVTLQTGAHQVLLAIGFSRQEYWSGLPFPFPGDLPEPGIEPTFLTSPALAGGFFVISTIWEACSQQNTLIIFCYIL